MLAMADAREPASELSAYTDSAAPPSAPVTPPSTPSTPAVVKASHSTPVVPQDSLPDSWDDAAELTLPPAMEAPTVKEASSQRSLRPGGKQGYNINLHQAAAVVRFTKQEILALRPADKFPNPLSMFGTISSSGETSAPGSAQKAAGGSQWNKSQRGDGRPEADGWKRDNAVPSPAHGPGGKHKKSNSSAAPMPKKPTVDPTTALLQETMALLNKLTPQTFDKLGQSFLSLNVQNIAQMNKVIEYIFEKAVQEPNFANLYAALCAFLNTKVTQWEFYTVFRVVNSEPTPESQYEFFWIKECTFPAVYAGPYFSYSDILAALYTPDLPPMQPVNFTPEPTEQILLNAIDLLVRVSRHEKSNAYYVTYLPFSEFGEEMRSQSTFADPRSALKDAKNKNYFRAKLVTYCQQEFQKSIRNESIYSNLEAELRALEASKASMSESDYFFKAGDIEERRIKLRRRMLGNIRFVGELFKQKLLTEATIQTCISDLMGTPEGWKDMHDEQDIDCLCHLLTTVGERLEAKVSQNFDSHRHFSLYFDRLRALARDKTLNSRMRFAIEEVLALRDNDWQKRRAQEGPVKIAELHKKLLAEQNAPHHPPVAGGRAPPAGGMPPQRPVAQAPRILARGRTGPQDVRRAAGPPMGAELGPTVSAGGYEQGGYRMPTEGAPLTVRPPQGGDPLRRTQSEYSSGAATPVSAGSNTPNYSNPSHSAAEPPRHLRNVSSERPIAEEAVDFGDKTLQNRAKSVVSEFLEQKDVLEVKLFLSDGPRGTCGHFILQVIDKCLNAKKGPVLPALLAVLVEPSISEELQADKEEVLQALRWNEEFKCLVDTTMDFMEAPERFAAVMAALARAQVITAQDVRDIAQEAHANCVEELMSDEAESRTIFERFTRQFTADS